MRKKIWVSYPISGGVLGMKPKIQNLKLFLGGVRMYLFLFLFRLATLQTSPKLPAPIIGPSLMLALSSSHTSLKPTKLVTLRQGLVSVRHRPLEARAQNTTSSSSESKRLRVDMKQPPESILRMRQCLVWRCFSSLQSRMDRDQHLPLSCSDSRIRNTPGSLSKYSSRRSASRRDVFGKNHLLDRQIDRQIDRQKHKMRILIFCLLFRKSSQNQSTPNYFWVFKVNFSEKSPPNQKSRKRLILVNRG